MKHLIAEYSWGGIAVIALIAAISLVWLLHELFTDKGQHAMPRRDQRAEKAELNELIAKGLPPYNGETHEAHRRYSPDHYRREPEE